MKTDDLIAQLSENLKPVPRATVARSLGLGLFVGAVGAVFLLRTTMKLRPDLGMAILGASFWIKFFYTFALAALAFWIVERQTRGSADSRIPVWLLLVPLTFLAIMATLQLAAPDADKHHLIMGNSARVCSFLILLLSLPIFAGLFWAMRKLAPTRLSLAGGAAGVLAGAVSATIYGFHCPETAAPFILIWYSLGILLAAGLGALVGRWVLRW